MANVQKYTKAACGHLFKHYEHAQETNSETGQLEYIKLGNQEINTQLTHLNYNLAVHQTMSQGDFIRKRCSEVKLQNRKDVNVMCSWVLTAPKDLPEAEHKDFFKESYDFMAKRYGEENVISAYVHFDETTPHIHFTFVPVTVDKKKGGYKVSAKEVVNRKDLQMFHQDLSDHLKKALGHSVAILNDVTKNGNKTIAELKGKSALERVEKAEKKLAHLQKQVNRQLNYLPAISAETLGDNIHFNGILKSFDEIKTPLISKSKAKEFIDAVVKKADKAIKEYDKVSQTNIMLRKVNSDAQKTNEKLKNEIERLRNENIDLRQELSVACKLENAVQRLGLTDVISAEVDRQATEEKSRQKEKKQTRNPSR